ncbi:hypothetical protein [Gallaecimonas mangrovi]|uniref:hypothetical protein n=1 Tax=Gallaecimonas mangrovi TaxID=2291597 RepID=UPI000E2023D9|nr:hypothetical protein [Gallaecimonas mangrovi]
MKAMMHVLICFALATSATLHAASLMPQPCSANCIKSAVVNGYLELSWLGKTGQVQKRFHYDIAHADQNTFTAKPLPSQQASNGNAINSTQYAFNQPHQHVVVTVIQYRNANGEILDVKSSAVQFSRP